MLSYQHIYHAGCLADVHKHLVLVRVLEEIVKSPKPLTYVETHAGRGIYDLSSPEAHKTGEAKEGILPLLNRKRLNGNYIRLIERARDKYGKYSYPGSPFLAQHMLRKTDQIFLHELHPQEYDALRQNFGGKNISVKRADGYGGCMQVAPKGRCLVLVDPSFEIKSEYEQAAYFLEDLHEKRPEAVLLLWYPMLKNYLFKDMAEYLEKLGFPGYLRHEVRFADPAKVRGMFGSGMIGVNLPLDDNAFKAITALFHQ